MSNKIARVASLMMLLTLLLSVGRPVQAAPPLPPVDMFQLPWELGKAWVVLEGFDNGFRREVGSPHHYLNGGAVDFAPHNNMRKGEDTSNFWVTAVAGGTVVETSRCHLKVAHANGWISEYYHLASFQVSLGASVQRNQRLAVIANASNQPVCIGSVETDIPHLHFALRPNMVGATFAGWEFKYSSFFNRTTFVKNGISLGLFQPLLNESGATPGSTPTPTGAPTGMVNTPTASPTAPFGPHVSTTVDPGEIQVGGTALVTVRLNNVPSEGYTSAEFTCTYDPALLEASNLVVASLFGVDPASAVSGPQNGSFILAIAGSKGNKATTSGIVFTFDVSGLAEGISSIECSARVSQGSSTLTEIPSIGTSLTMLGLSPTSTPPPPQVFTPTPTAFGSDWLTFTNVTYGFEFKYPPQGQIVAGRNDNFSRINLPFVPGTSLQEKYLEMDVVQNANPCRSPVAAASIVSSSETVLINGISFLKEVGGDAAAGNLYQFVAYSTLRDNICVSLSFVLHSLNPGNFSTPPPAFDYAVESAVFGQIVSTYMWLASSPTATPSPAFTPTPASPGNLVSSLSFVPVAGGLSQPLFVTHAGDGSGRLFVLERVGRIRVIAGGNLLSTPFLDLTSIVRSTGSEEGILGLAFHPNYEANGLFFVTYNNASGDLVLARYSISSDPNVADPASATMVLTIPHPTNANHNGGMIAFGGDGYLYWSTGDGGGAGDVPNNAQNTNVLLGKILRLDVNSGSPYVVPPDNPFVGVSGARGEIWDFGLRNPWRFSFDRSTGDLYIGDVGQGSREEIDHEPASSSGGFNYGWRVMEGSLCFNPASGCDTSGKVLPVTEYDNNSSTCAVTGGYVYRGPLSPPMTGIYFYGDFCSGEIWGLLRQPSGIWVSDLIVDTSFMISSFGEDEAGELYLTDYATGSIQRIVGPAAPAASPTPTLSSMPSATPMPTFTFTPPAGESHTPTFTFTPLPSPTLAPSQDGTLTGQVIASNPVLVSLYDSGTSLVTSVTANPDGTFNLLATPGNYTVVATSNGYLSAQGSAPLVAGSTTTKPIINLLAGDIDANNVIDQFDAMTLGINYGSASPSAADLNNDGIINVLDLELLAKNYRKTGPLVWE